MKTLLPAIRLFIALTVLTGVIYPLLVTGIAKAVFPKQAERQPRHRERKNRRLGTARAAVRRG